MARIHSILILVLLFLILLIGGTTLFVFFVSPSKIGANLRHQDPSAQKITRDNTYFSDTAVYSQLGRLRAATSDAPPVSLIVSPYFPYPSDDEAFYEEISLKNRKIKLIIIEYFSKYESHALKKRGEQKIKEDLVQLINDELVMGKISALFFEEFIILD